MDAAACLAKLAELGISHETRQHPTPVMTVEAQVGERMHLACRPGLEREHHPHPFLQLQAADLAGVEGAVTKNLFLKVRRACAGRGSSAVRAAIRLAVIFAANFCCRPLQRPCTG